MRVVFCSLLLAGCVYDYAALGGRRADGGVGGAGTGRGGAAGSVVVGSGGRGVTGTGGAPGSGGAISASGGGPGTGGTGGAAGGGGRAAGGGTGGGTGSSVGSGGRAAGGAAGGMGGRAAGGAAGAVDPDLVLWYKLDEETGTTAADSSGAPGGPRNGTLMVGGTGGAGAFSAVHQVGTHSVNLTANTNVGGGFVMIPPLIELAPQAVTLSAWVFARVDRDWQRVFDFGTDATTNLFLTISEGNDTNNFIRFAVTVGGYTMEQQINAQTALPLDSWHHLAVTLAGGAPYTGTLYLDGALAGTNTAMTLHAADLGVTPNNYLGRSQFAADWYFNGQLDDFRVYKRALTAAEISTLYALR